MSLIIELAGFIGGAMSEYAQQKQWGSFKIFTATFSVFFILLTFYFMLFTPTKGFLFGASYSFAVGAALGLINVFIIRYAIRRKQASANENL